ncbi:MAG: T9SS type A sorting domain-containing protein [candidate division WOR-3 bacterium]|nr:MAG: T9SS type A sorting domain-containing protein [candidate division WOR-3 bacterium]
MKHLGVVFFILPILIFGAVHQVDMVGLTFVPDTLSISEGDSVLWVNASALFHTTTSGTDGVPNGYWDSGLMSPNDSFVFHFDSAGVFPYFCTPHWTLGMIGLVTVAPVGIDEVQAVEPAEISLALAYPNPFTRTVRLDYSVNVGGRLEVTIYDSAGETVRRLVDADLAVGRHTVLWDGVDDLGRRAGSGVYYIGAHINGTSVQEKVLLLR